MSYFSHHPEAWDEIEVEGVLDKLISYYCIDNDDDNRETTTLGLRSILIELQAPSSKHPKDKVLWTALTDWAAEQISDEERSYFDRFVP